MLIIPAIDLKDGKCVRLRQGNMADATVFSSNPLEMAKHWVEQGAKRLHLVDLDGAVSGKPVHVEVIAEIAKIGIPVQVGGGIRTRETVEAYFKLGVQYVIVGTWAVREPETFLQLTHQYPNRLMLGLDAKQEFVAIEGWEKESTESIASVLKRFESAKLAAVIYTDISRDGMLTGLNTDSIRRLTTLTKHPLIASGGVATIADIEALAGLDLQGVIVGRALYEGTLKFAPSPAGGRGLG